MPFKPLNIIDKLRRSNNNNNNNNSKKVFYVCSYGGCGSKILCEYLEHFGTVKHVHSRQPPLKLTHIGLNAKWHEWFSTIPIPDKDLPNHYVIYIYRDPVKAIQSRFSLPQHLAHIQANPVTTLSQVLSTKQDMYGIENFFDNYTNSNPSSSIKRNYKIYCIKYEDLFNNIDELNRVLNIHCHDKQLYPIEKVTAKPITPDIIILREIYAKLIEKMRRMKFITIV